MARELFDILTFDHNVVENVPITTTDPDWTELIDLVTPTRAAGLYGLAFSLQFSLHGFLSPMLHTHPIALSRSMHAKTGECCRFC